MSLMEIFYGAKIVEAAIGKAKGKNKDIDDNVQGRKEKKPTTKVDSKDNVDELFDYIESEANEYVIEQREYLHVLCRGFKRPYVHESDKSFRNMIFVFGPEGSGRKYAIRVIAKLMAIKKLLKESSIYKLDYSQYDTGEKVEKLLLPDLYKAFYGKSEIVLIDNFDQASPQAIQYISNLGINGSIKTDKRFAWKNGKLIEATGTYELGTSDRISANNKYIVIVSKNTPDYLNKVFPKQFVDKISDVACTNRLSNNALGTIAESYLEDCNEALKKNSGASIEYDGFSDRLLETCTFKKGTLDLYDTIQHKIHDKIVQHMLNGVYKRGDTIKLAISDAAIIGNGIFLDKLVSQIDEALLLELDQELEDIIGLSNVKDFVKKLREHVAVMQNNETGSERPSLHMIFTGNPGTGKTTIARLVSKYLKALGYLSSGHLVEASRADLVAQYMGQTANKTISVIKSAQGGVLFIDEAYALVRSKEDFFGIEAVDTLVKYMEDMRDDLVVILAGYTKEISEFLNVNSGLKSRFNYYVEFPDYTPEEMVEIADTIAKHKGYNISSQCYPLLKRYYNNLQLSNPKDFGNGRLARNTVEKAIVNHSTNLIRQNDKEDLRELLPEDFDLQTEDLSVVLAEADQKLENVIGLEEVKSFVRHLKKHVEFEKLSGSNTKLSYNMIFTGNPGTGKTTIARIIAQYMKGLGVLSNGQFVEASRSELVSGYAGQTAIKTSSIIENAIGGVLFIDEAYSLVQGANDSFGMEAVNTLVKRMEDLSGSLIVILAGYSKEMSSFLNSNPGLRSRFAYNVEFPDYSADELVQISHIIAKSQSYSISSDALVELQSIYEKKNSANRTDSGNGRLARNVVEGAIFKHSQRIIIRGSEAMDDPDRFILTKQDFITEKEIGDSFDLEKELSNVVGLKKVKDHLRSLHSLLQFEKARAELGLGDMSRQSLHMIFTGNPGTGKTTIARIVAKLFYEMGIIPTSKLVETDRSALVAGYVGQTAEKTLGVLEQANGGVLFVDEAYSLGNGTENDFGQEAIDTMIKYMEDHREEIIVVLAGYTKEMKEFLGMNSGLVSRFPTIIEFPDYTAVELLEIIKKMYKDNNYVLAPATDEVLLQVFDKAKKEPNFGNGRFARNLYEKSIRNLSMRVTKAGVFTKETLTTVLPIDVSSEL